MSKNIEREKIYQLYNGLLSLYLSNYIEITLGEYMPSVEENELSDDDLNRGGR